MSSGRCLNVNEIIENTPLFPTLPVVPPPINGPVAKLDSGATGTYF